MLKYKYGLRFLSHKSIHCKYTTCATKSNKSNASNDEYERNLSKYRDKILFHSFMDRNKLEQSYMRQQMHQHLTEKIEMSKIAHIRNLPPLPISLKYVVSEEKLIKEASNEIELSARDEIVQLPFGKSQKITKKRIEEQHPVTTSSDEKVEFDRSDINRWMTNYEYFDDAKLQDESDIEEDMSWASNYGSPDPKTKISNVPCSGCGALLHCTDSAIPGYIPSEIFKGRTSNELKTIECQRCHFLKEYNIALNINVDPEDYLLLLSNIKNKKALVIVMVDLLDFPCSIWPKLLEIIGTKRPVIIVGNKVDLLPGDEKGYLERIRQTLISEIKKTSLAEANIKEVSLISAKTGYGVEELVSTLFKAWLGKGDVYLIGCTNVGKSSLFNALLQSDYCKVHAHDLIKRATVSRWPGTTLNLLKFPINRPSGWKIYHRNQRLKIHEKLLKAKIEFLHEDYKFSAKRPSLIGLIGRTFVDPKKEDEQSDDLYSYGNAGGVKTKFGINERDEVFAQSKWLYDTPGVVHPDQILSLLTAEELLTVLPKSIIQPHSYYLQPGQSIFIAGLARLDFTESTYPCRFTVFCSNELPITVCNTKDAEELYEKFLGTNLLSVPKGGIERLDKWPGLQKQEQAITLTGVGNKENCADIVLSTAGWISVAAPNTVDCKLFSWTPEGRGIHVRQPPLLKYGIMLKGKRVRDTPAYRLSNYVTHNPQKTYNKDKK